MSIELLDGHSRSINNPVTFPIPDTAARSNLVPGDYAKLIFQGDVGVERMWVEVTGKDGDSYVGTLSNHPNTLREIKHGDEVRFRPLHVIDITRAEDA